MGSSRPWGCLISCFITVLISVAMLIFSSVSINKTYYLRALWSQIYSLSIFTLCISIFTIIFACGLFYVALRQYPSALTIFSGLLIFMAFLCITCSILLIIGLHNVVENTYTDTTRVFANYSESKYGSNSQEVVARVQQEYKCCGVGRATDWKYEYPNNSSTPDSCCVKVVKGCGQGALLTQNNIYLRGCAEPILVTLQEKYTGLITLVFFLMAFSIISAIFGVMYDNSLEQQYQMM